MIDNLSLAICHLLLLLTALKLLKRPDLDADVPIAPADPAAPSPTSKLPSQGWGRRGA